MATKRRPTLSGEEFRAWMDSIGATRTEVARCLGVGLQTIRSLELGQVVVTRILLLALMEASRQLTATVAIKKELPKQKRNTPAVVTGGMSYSQLRLYEKLRRNGIDRDQALKEARRP